MEKKLQEKASLLDRFLDTVERVCNKLPPPAILFGILFVITAIVGALCTQAGFALENPASHKLVASQNFFTKEGIQWLLTTMVKNFTGFAPLGLVITMTLAIGFCEESGHAFRAAAPKHEERTALSRPLYCCLSWRLRKPLHLIRPWLSFRPLRLLPISVSRSTLLLG